MQFQLATPTEIIYGENSLSQSIEIISRLGKHALLITGSHPNRSSDFIKQIRAHGVAITRFKISKEPTVDLVQRGLEEANICRCDFVIAMGGGSVIDAGKSIAALKSNTGDIYEYLEVVGEGKALEKTPIPLVAIPTTAGTGAEITKNAVLESTEHKVKVSLRSPLLYPELAIIDPTLTCSCPQNISIACAMDALTQLIESYITKNANPYTEALCREGIRKVANAIYKVYENPADLEARCDLSIAALFSGMTLSNAGLGAVHGLAGPMGGLHITPSPHGMICAALLPAVMKANYHRSNEVRGLSEKFRILGTLLRKDLNACAEDGIQEISRMQKDLNLLSLSKLGFSSNDFTQIIEQSKKSSSMRGNPIELSEAELLKILESSL